MSQDKNKICDPKVFEEIFRTYAKDLKRFLYFKTRDMDVAEDIMQDTFVTLWSNCSNVSYEKVKSYLFTVGNNLFLNMKKREKLMRSHQNEVSSRPTNESPEFIMLEKEFLEKIERTIANLPENDREVFLLNRIEKKKYREIAEKLDISIKTVEKRMHNALKTMKEHIGKV